MKQSPAAERFRGWARAYMFTLGARKNVRHTIAINIERGDAVLEGVVRSDDSLGMALSAYRDSIAGGLSCIRRLQSARSSWQGVLGDELDAIYPGEESDTLEQFLVMLDGRVERAGVVQRLMSLTSDFLAVYTPSQRSGKIVLNWGLIGLLWPFPLRRRLLTALEPSVVAELPGPKPRPVPASCPTRRVVIGE